MTLYPYAAFLMTVGLLAGVGCSKGKKTLVVEDGFEGPVMVVFGASANATPSRGDTYVVPDSGVVFFPESFDDRPRFVVVERRKDGTHRLPTDVGDDTRQAFEFTSGVQEPVRWVSFNVGKPSDSGWRKARRELEDRVVAELSPP